MPAQASCEEMVAQILSFSCVTAQRSLRLRRRRRRLLGQDELDEALLRRVSVARILDRILVHTLSRRPQPHLLDRERLELRLQCRTLCSGFRLSGGLGLGRRLGFRGLGLRSFRICLRLDQLDDLQTRKTRSGPAGKGWSRAWRAHVFLGAVAVPRVFDRILVHTFRCRPQAQLLEGERLELLEKRRAARVGTCCLRRLFRSRCNGL
eukprot:COSAG04_NODE_1485_length_6559_cov_7.307585_6_plen_207_part_00